MSAVLVGLGMMLVALVVEGLFDTFEVDLPLGGQLHDARLTARGKSLRRQLGSKTLAELAHFRGVLASTVVSRLIRYRHRAEVTTERHSTR